MLGHHGVGLRTDRRAAPRYDITVPIHLEPARKGVTRNVSTTGVLFELVDGPAAMGAGVPVRFRLGLRSVGNPLCCEGRVVRLEENGSCIVATTIETCWFG